MPDTWATEAPKAVPIVTQSTAFDWSLLQECKSGNGVYIMITDSLVT